jgi:hypothetical protein
MSEDQAQSEPVAQPQPTTPEQHVMMMASHHAMSQHNTTMMAAILALQAQVQANGAVIEELMGARGMGNAKKPSQEPADGVSPPAAVLGYRPGPPNPPSGSYAPFNGILSP